MAKPVKQPINFNFQRGLNLKADPYQVPTGSYLSLVNSVFDKMGRLSKRNGFPYLPTLPNTTTSYLTTFNGDLQALGEDLLALSASQDQWLEKGSTYPLKLSTMPLVRNSLNQAYADIAVAPNGLICTVYTEAGVYKYVVADSTTGQNVIEPTLLPNAVATYGTPRVYVLGNYFTILYTTHPTTYHLVYLAISYLNTNLTPLTGTVAATYSPATTVAFDAIVLNNSLYIAYNGAAASGIKMVALNNLLVLSPTFTVDGAHSGTIFTMAVDEAHQTVWTTYWDAGTQAAYTTAVTTAFIQQLPPTLIIPSAHVLNMASLASNNVLSLWYEELNTYAYDTSIDTNTIDTVQCTITGSVGATTITVRSVGLASKAFSVNGTPYFLASYQSPYQPTYFLINATGTEAAPLVVAKLAYQNGGGYLTTGLPNVSVTGDMAQTPYLFKDLIQAVNKNTNVPAGNQVAGVYSQTGVNLASFVFTTEGLASTEIGQNLNITGGFLWGYDGFVPTENNFFLYPDQVEAAGTGTTGSLSAQQYFYQVTYEWTDNQGNAFRSAPSIPVTVTLTSDTSIAINVPTLRLTYKTAGIPIKICIYRWSTAQQSYYQVTSITAPVENNLTIDSIRYLDILSDADILGNNLLYTTGGVLEDTSAPASNILALFDDRLWLVDAEDQNLLWYSKQVIEATPVEMSDLLTFYIAPSTGAQGSTGTITALYPMDDKLIIFKKDALYYINGSGPDNTGAQNGYSQPIFISGTVGCDKPRSIVMSPSGLMFKTDKGIWLLGRDLSTTYVGAPVEDFNNQEVVYALAIPDTNQVRFGLDGGSTLMFDYFVNEWGQFKGIPSVSGTLYAGAHTIVNQYGQVSQEKPNTYLDGTSPVLMSFTTAWLKLEGLRGYMRAFWFSFLGTFLSPHKLQVSVAYDYNSSATQSDLILPINYSGPYGSYPYYGGDGHTPYGGPTPIEQWRVFLERQRCKAFQITIQEVFDPQYGTIAGPGLTMSGVSCMVGFKNSYAPVPQNQQVG